MMKMKNFKLKFGSLLASGLMMVAVSCSGDFLDVAPTGLLAEAQLTSLAGIDASLILTLEILRQSTLFKDLRSILHLVM
jgi:energy-converting hydrogenase Eha subunit C